VDKREQHPTSVLLGRDDAVAVITLNRPDVLNAVNPNLCDELEQAIRECAADDSVRAVVLRGSGRSFSAGLDLSALANGEICWQFFTDWERTLSACERLPKPVIAAIHGHCIGAGLQLAMTCDLRYGAHGASFALPAAKEGLIPGFGIHRLPRYVGLAAAKRLALFEQSLGCHQAREVGLLDEIVPYPDSKLYCLDEPSPAEQVLDYALARAHDLAQQLPTVSFTACKMLLSLQNEPCMDLIAQYLDQQNVCINHPDHQKAAERWRNRRRGSQGHDHGPGGGP
jgi:enoyl-CoA hydratase/carnithine racemase